jgi:type IV secretory pathway VirB10-like protein
VPVVGSRFLIEAGFIIAVAVIAGIERLGTWWIIAVVASAWIIVAIVEIAMWARHVVAGQPRAIEPSETQPEATLVVSPPVHVRAKPPVETRRAEVEREPAPEPEVEQAPVPEPPRVVAVPPPPPEPEPEPELEPEPEPEPARVVAFIPANDGPREWNLWELERAARDHATDDVVRNEERAYLLMYLREFAGPDGVLPTDFDGLVRDAFGDVLHTVGA